MFDPVKPKSTKTTIKEIFKTLLDCSANWFSYS